ncbi:MAG: acetyl-coenzyme A synthetase N-terminal domain-containing protein, partial [Parvibaculum sp.]
MGDLLWSPSAEMAANANVTAFISWLNTRGHSFRTYEQLRRWSVDDIAAFWEAVWHYFDVTSSAPYDCVLRDAAMPGATWFPGARVNYIETLLSKGDGEKTAIYAASEEGAARTTSWSELKSRVFKLATALRELGVGPGDRVASYL